MPMPPSASAIPPPTCWGRVTLNPAKHIDPWGTLVMPALALVYHLPLLGWAKPCPVTTRNFRKMRRDDILTTAAGPASNLAMALVALVLLVILKHVPGAGANAVFAAMDIATRVSTDTADLPRLFPLALLLYYGILTNCLLFVFNLIPIPPLDGSRILRYFLPYNVERLYNNIGNYGILIVFLFAGRLIGPIYRPLLNAFDSILIQL